MVKNIQNEIAHEAYLLAEKLITQRDLDYLKYLTMRDNIKKDLGESFYNKYLAWHERDDINANDD